jgi:GT2 family glycosyltransferase
MSISVLLATFNRASLLEQCLAQLGRQTFETGDEIVVADNGSTDTTAAIVEAAARRLRAPVRYVRETAPGKSHALATAVAISHGEILALTDDDVIVADDWLATIRALWQEADLGLAGGRVTPRWERPAPRWLRLQAAGGYGRLAAPLALLDYGPGRTPLGARTALGANMAVARRALEAAGGFPLDLGKLRGTLLSGEDHQVCERVQAAGFTAVYDPRLVVQHHVPADRLRLGYHLRWFFWSGITNAALDHAGAAAGASARTRHWAARISRHAARAMRAALAAAPDRAVEAMTEIAFALGYLAFTRGWMRAHVGRGNAGSRRLEVT